MSPKGTRLTAGIPGTGLSWTDYEPHSPNRSDRTSSVDIVPQSIPTEHSLAAIESAPAEQINEYSTSELVPILNAAQKRILLTPFALFTSICLFAAALIFGNQQLVNATALFTLTFLIFGILLNRFRRSTKLEYQFDDFAERVSANLTEAFADLKNCRAVWAVSAQGHTWDWKRNAGATKLNKRTKITLQFTCPNCIRSTIQFPCISLGTEQLYLLPDAMLVVSKDTVAALHYRDLDLILQPVKFIEEERVPSDAAVVDQTWRFVNKRGGPDRRFNFNKQLPVCLYGEMDFQSAGGLNGKIQFSNVAAGERLANILAVLGKPDTQVARFVASIRPSRSWPSILYVGSLAFVAAALALAIITANSAQPLARAPNPASTSISQEMVSVVSKEKPAPQIVVPPAAPQDRSSNNIVGEPLVISPMANNPPPAQRAQPFPTASAQIPFPRPRPKTRPSM